MKTPFIIVLMTLHFTALADVLTSATKPVFLPTIDKADPPAVILYRNDGMKAPDMSKPVDKNPEFNKVRVAAWSDGRIVWSHDLNRGGSPYFKGKIDKSRLINFYRFLESETSATTHERTTYLIPDSGSNHIIIRFNAPDVTLNLASSHPAFNDPKVHYSSQGVTSAANYDPAAEVTPEESKFRNFRLDFDRIAEAISNLPPSHDLRFR